MEQSDTVQMQILQVEEISTDINVQTIQIANKDVKAATSAEGDQDSPKACSPPLEPTLVVDDTDINVEVATEDHLDTSHIDVSVKNINSDAGYNNQIESESNQPKAKVYTSEQEQIEIYEQIKDETIDSNHELQPLCIQEDQSQIVITESKIVEAKQKTTDILESGCNVEDANQSDNNDKQCLTLDEFRLNEHSGGQIHDAHDELIKETIREIPDNDSNQNSSIVTDAELTKLVQEETEVVVVVETIEPATTDAAADNFIVTLDEKNVDKECNQDTVVTLQEKEITKSRHGNNEIDLIDYSQESDDTIIEVTEVIDAPVTEQYKQQDNKDNVENNEYHMESVKLTDGKQAIHKDINDENIQSKAIDGETLISSSNKEDDITIIIDEKIIITEDVDSELTTDQPIENIHENIADTEHKQDDIPAREIPVVESSMKKRSVIQDIFDDWGVENTDEDAQSTSKVHDTVEIELKSLLDETKSDQVVTNESVQDKIPSSNKESATDELHDVVDTSEKSIKHSTEQIENQKKNKTIDQDAEPLNRSGKNSPALAADKSSRSVETRAFNKTPQSHIATSLPKNRSRHLTSQIASPAEVTEVLKERLREKQKTVVDSPRGPDIFFVKKLTQRLSNKLAGSSVNPVPGLIPLPQQDIPSSPPAFLQSTNDNCDKKIANETTETSKDSNSDNKELLAILEGDVDPDWSILKPPTLTEEGKMPPNAESQSDHSGPPKLDPLVERELALKQLLELPVTSPKKISPRKKKTFRAAPGKVSKDVEVPLAVQEEKELASMDSASENAQPNTKSIEINLCSPQKSGQKDHGIKKVVTREESRSGRKRKPTEKAREHEENTIKRQKVYKGKLSMNKKQTQENISDENTTIENHMPSDALIDVNNEKAVAKEVASKQVQHKVDSISNKIEGSRPKPSLARKGSQPIAKRKIVVKRLLRQKMPASEKSVRLKGKLTPSPKKSPPKTVSKSQKRTAESASGDVKHKKKIINEIDRLLQDEGVVNLLYDVEQPNKKRLVPITKSRAKVMDLQKVQRELKIRKKLVRNAVLRLRTSTVAGVTKVSPRSKRASIHPIDIQVDRKIGELIASPKTPASPTEFILPAKIRNAADASIIIRRHSSSSFSSASGSPRVSVDAPEKPAETGKTDDGAIHSLRSAKKRRDSQDEKIINAKKSKKKTVQKSDTESVAATGTVSTTTTITTTTNANAIHNMDEKIIVAARPTKKSEIKKIDKIGKQQENVHAFEDNVSSKVTTRSSNGAVTGKVTAKSRRAAKSKVTFVGRASDPDNADNSSKEEDELSACLAEAATALSIVSAGSRSGSVMSTRKSKGRIFHDSISFFLK